MCASVESCVPGHVPAIQVCVLIKKENNVPFRRCSEEFESPAKNKNHIVYTLSFTSIISQNEMLISNNCLSR